MRLLPRALIFLLIAVSVSVQRAYAADAVDAGWQPPGIDVTSADVTTVLSKAAAAAPAAPADAQRVERYAVYAQKTSFDAVATIRDGDYAVASSLSGSTFGAGRSGGVSWRRTPRGLVRRVSPYAVDDDLDRWSAARTTPSPAALLAGQTGHGKNLQWVLVDRGEQDDRRWYFIDSGSGRIVREVTRSGTRVETTTFDDFRAPSGVARPYHWHATGDGGDVEVWIEGVVPQPIDPARVAIPVSSPDTFPVPDRPIDIPARFDSALITIAASASGSDARFLVDTGSDAILLSPGFARRLHLPIALGRATLPTLTIGTTIAYDVPVRIVDHLRQDGVLGYGFFSGRIVHIDYRARRIELLPRGAAAVPANANSLATAWETGLPFVTARFDRITGSRFIVNTGADPVVVLASFMRRTHATSNDLGLTDTHVARTLTFVDGRVEGETASAAHFSLGFENDRLDGVEVQTQTQAQSTSPAGGLSLDGILGTDLLRSYEWWFDADGGRSWARRPA